MTGTVQSRDGVMKGASASVPHERLRSERGAALLLVLWVGAFFGLLLSGFAFSIRVETDAARNFRDYTEATLLAQAGISRAVADVVAVKQSAGGVSASFRPWQVGPIRLGHGTYRVNVTNEESRICLNHASEAVLKRLLQRTGVMDAHVQDIIAASILDWRDPDDTERNNGAETDYYRSRSLPHSAKNGAFQFVEELLSVRGMTREMFYGTVRDPQRLALLQRTLPENRELAPGEYLGLRSFLTVHGSGKVDYRTAEIDVLTASELPAEAMREILRSREQELKPGETVRGADPGVGRVSQPTIYRIDSTGSIDHSPIVSHLSVTVTREGTMRAPRMRVVAWQEQEEHA